MSGYGTPPGWYPDPSNPYGQRWWDGAAWTAATAPGGGPPPGPPGPKLAGFWHRFAAWFLDGSLLGVPFQVLGYTVVDPVVIEPGETVDVADLFPASIVVLQVFFVLVSVAYFAYFEGTSGQTFGKKVLDIRVVDADTLQPGIGTGRAVGRWFGRLLAALPCLLGLLWMLWDDQHQGWHDKLVRTKVLTERG